MELVMETTNSVLELFKATELFHRRYTWPQLFGWFSIPVAISTLEMDDLCIV